MVQGAYGTHTPMGKHSTTTITKMHLECVMSFSTGLGGELMEWKTTPCLQTACLISPSSVLLTRDSHRSIDDFGYLTL